MRPPCLKRIDQRYRKAWVNFLRAFFLLLVFVIASTMMACTVDGKLSDESKNKTMVCTDTRDGESFSYHTSSVSNVRLDYFNRENSSFDVVDANGVKRHLVASMETYLKCVEQ